MKNAILLWCLIFIWNYSTAQTVADTLFQPEIHAKTYPDGDGTTIYIDEAHNNFHTKDGRYYTFAQLLAADGYPIKGNQEKLHEDVLSTISILVIANAESDSVSHPIVAPTKPAFSSAEIQAVKTWVENGGSLFLIADHMPFAGAAASLAEAFGFQFYDSFVMYSPNNGAIEFSRKKGTLSDHFITNGNNEKERVEKIRTFTGQGFKIPTTAKSILQLDASQTVYLTDTMWVINKQLEHFPATGLSQGAVMPFGKGKIAVFGEAAMFSAQLAGPKQMKVGMNSKKAKENYQLLLNVVHWLDGKLGE